MSNETVLARFKKMIEQGDMSIKEYKRCPLYIKEGIIYSYGEHYPLATKFKDVWLVNDYGYSSTTRKHLSLMLHLLRDENDVVMSPASLRREAMYYGTTRQGRLQTLIRAMIDGAKSNIVEKTDELDNHTRKSNKPKISRLKSEIQYYKSVVPRLVMLDMDVTHRELL